MKDFELNHCQISSWRIEEENNEFVDFKDVTVCLKWLFELITWYHDNYL